MDGGRLRAVAFKQTWCTISLRNTSGYSARNPAVIVRLHGMVFLNRDHSLAKEWIVIDFSNTNGIKGIQWDGGPTYSIHGRSVRRLPALDLADLTCIPAWGDPAITFEILSDGYRRETSVPVHFTVDEESQFSTENREEPLDWI
jgi:hypothetical protein